MKIKYNKEYKPRAQRLRREATAQENHLWYDFFQKYPIQFRRQKQFGEFIVDFYCAKAKLVIELDGAQHYEEQVMLYDKGRTDYLEKQGLKVLRFLNREVNRNFKGVCEYIDIKVKERINNGF